MRKEHLYECPKCGYQVWDSPLLNPICVHETHIGYKMKTVYEPAHHEEPAAKPVSREVEE